MPPNDYKEPFTPQPKPRFSRAVVLSYLKKPYVWLPLGLLATALFGLGVYAFNQPESARSSQVDTVASWFGNDQSEGTTSEAKTDKDETDKDSKKKSDEKSESKKSTKKDSTTKKKSSTTGSTGGTTSGGESSGGSTGGSTGGDIGGSTGGSTGGTGTGGGGGGSTSGSFVKPNSSNTGPRYSTTRSLTPSQALAELRNTGYLSRVRITGSLSLSGSDGRNWVIEDSQILTSGSYGIHAYTSLADFTGTRAERPIFRYVEVIGAAAWDNDDCGAVVYGSDVVIQNADLYGCNDIVKVKHRMSLLNSWLHDVDSPSGAHSDTMQIRSARDSLIQGNRLDAYVGYVSDGSSTPNGRTASGGLQTGSVSGDISVRFIHNWFAGGHYTIRGWVERDEGYNIDYYFRDNIWMQNGTSVALGLTNLPPNRWGATTGSLGNFDSSNVWEGTGQPVR